MRSINLPSCVKAFFVVVAFFGVCNADAANWYVRPSAAGSQTGADWNNAWSLPGIAWGSVSAGDTIWLAGGSYSSVASALTFTKSGAAGNPIQLLRATAGDAAATNAAGWQASFDSRVIFGDGSSNTNTGFYFPDAISYINVDGRTSAAIPYGILLRAPSGGATQIRIGAGYSATCTGLNFSNMEIVNAVGTSAGNTLTGQRYGVDCFNTLQNSTFHHCFIHQQCEAFKIGTFVNVVVEYCTIADTVTDTGANGDHNDTLYSNGNHSGVYFRYNVFYNSLSDGILFESNSNITNWYLYGNIFYNWTWHVMCYKSPGKYQMFIYNNTFVGADAAGNAGYFQQDGTVTGKAYNNIFINCSGLGGGSGTIAHDYNAFYPAVVNGGSPIASGEGSHSFVLASNPLTSVTTGNLHLTAAGLTANPQLSAGVALTADGFLNVDMDGSTRGGSAGWCMGAYQYGALAPVAPGGLHFTAN